MVGWTAAQQALAAAVLNSGTVAVAPLSLAVVRIAVGLKMDGGDFKFMAAVVGVQLYMRECAR